MNFKNLTFTGLHKPSHVTVQSSWHVEMERYNKVKKWTVMAEEMGLSLSAQVKVISLDLSLLLNFWGFQTLPAGPVQAHGCVTKANPCFISPRY